MSWVPEGWSKEDAEEKRREWVTKRSSRIAWVRAAMTKMAWKAARWAVWRERNEPSQTEQVREVWKAALSRSSWRPVVQ